MAQQVISIGSDRSLPIQHLRWNTVTSTDPDLLQSPSRRHDIKAYQLEPRPLFACLGHTFIADDVGLARRSRPAS